LQANFWNFYQYKKKFFKLSKMSFLLEAQSIWENFAKYKINDYAKLRNFDFGPNNESSVSKLSPFITHRILSEYDLIHDIKSKYKIKNST